MRVVFFILIVLLTPQLAFAGLVIIEPDDYPSETNLRNVSPYVTFTTPSGGNVYARNIAPDAAGGNNTRGLGRKVFGNDMADDWMFLYQTSSVPNDSILKEYRSLQIEFHVEITYFSLIIAELDSFIFDPVDAYIFDRDGNFLETKEPIRKNKRVELGHIPNMPADYIWNYYTFEYSNAAPIGKVIISGQSQLVAFDRLSFIYSEVDEPSGLWLMLLGSALLCYRFRRNPGW